MTRTDRLRAALAQHKPAAAAPPTPPAPAPEPTAKEKRAAKRAASPTITHACGHTRPLIDLTNMHCPACREKARQERALRKRAKREAQKAAQPAPAPDAGRLPDGSKFDLEPYDATAQCWTGSLTVPGYPVFTSTASGLFRLLKNLDALYRAAVAGAAKEAT